MVLMDKALEMGKSSATGSFHLLLGVAGSTVIMAIGTIVLGMLLPQKDVGLYGMALDSRIDHQLISEIGA